MKPSVCIDGFNLGLRKGSGIATYGRNLNAALQALGYETHILRGPPGRVGKNNLLNEVALEDAQVHQEEDFKFQKLIDSNRSPFGRVARRVERTGDVMFSAATERAITDVTWAAQDVFERANRRYAAYRLPTRVRLGWNRAERPDAMHWTCPLPLSSPGIPNLYTIHDLVPLRLPFATLDNKRNFHAICKRICRDADHIVTVSESARNDIMKLFKVSEDRITNTYQGVSLPPALTERSDDEVSNEVEGVFGLDWKGYFLFFGAIEPKKNLGRIIEAYLSSGSTAPFVIIGGAAWLDEDETRLIYDDIVGMQILKDGVIRRADRIRRYDYLPFHALVSLIRGAKATLFPSIYEGFGLPVLESMLLGTPVLTSTGGSLPEVAGDAAHVVDPYDVDQITAGIRALDQDADLRADLVVRGRAQAAKFSPEVYQEKLGAMYSRFL